MTTDEWEAAVRSFIDDLVDGRITVVDDGRLAADNGQPVDDRFDSVRRYRDGSMTLRKGDKFAVLDPSGGDRSMTRQEMGIGTELSGMIEQNSAE